MSMLSGNTTDLSLSESMSFIIEGEVNVRVTVTENGSGGLDFKVDVLDDTGQIGDLNGIFFDLSDPTLIDGLNANGQDVTNTDFGNDSVDNLGGGVNMKGEVVNEAGAFDAGVRTGTSGMAKDDLQSVEFSLSHEDEELFLEDVALMDFGVRLTSAGEPGGARDGSLKLGGTAPDVDQDDDGISDGNGDYSEDDTLPDQPDGDFPDDDGTLGGSDGGILDGTVDLGGSDLPPDPVLENDPVSPEPEPNVAEPIVTDTPDQTDPLIIDAPVDNGFPIPLLPPVEEFEFDALNEEEDVFEEDPLIL